MNTLTYSITAVIVYLGLAVGFLIAFMSKEELKFKKYFILGEAFVLGLIVFFSLVYYLNPYLVCLIALIVVLVLMKYKSFYEKSYIIYPVLAVLFFISSRYKNLFVVVSSLIFFYGFLVSALGVDFKEKNYFRLLLKNCSFIVIALIFLIF